jgi:hypothetical protein
MWGMGYIVEWTSFVWMLYLFLDIFLHAHMYSNITIFYNLQLKKVLVDSEGKKHVKNQSISFLSKGNLRMGPALKSEDHDMCH